MSKYDKTIKQYNAISYLCDFINTYLPLTFEEQTIYTMHKEGSLNYETSDKTDWHLNQDLRKQGFVLCKGCGEILQQSEFYGHMRYCKKCYLKRRNANGNNKHT